MEGIRGYLLSVCAAAILCGILQSMLPGKGSSAALLRLVSGILMTLVVISPLRTLRLDEVQWVWDSILAESAALVSEGERSAEESVSAIIKQRTEAYILDKAAAYGADVTVEVGLSGDAVPVPNWARISGNLSPYLKSVLSAQIAEDLGIAKEQQTWILAS